MAWRDSLLKGSFRNVPFEIESHSFNSGRRGQSHSYVGRDVPFFEDLGRKRRQINLTAFVVGEDYMSRRDSLIEACERGGSGTLVHPYLGHLEVHCENCDLNESRDEGRVARFSLSFVESGQRRFPKVDADLTGFTDIAAENLFTVSIEDFQFGLVWSDVPEFVRRSVDLPLRKILEIVRITNPPVDISLSLEFLAKEANAGTLTPKKLGKAVTKVFRDLGYAGDGMLSMVRRLTEFSYDIAGIPASTILRRLQIDNISMFGQFVRCQAVATEARLLTRATFASHSDAINALESFVARSDSIARQSGIRKSGNVYEAMELLRSAVTKDLTSRAGGLPRIGSILLQQSLPSLVQAYELYGDARRDWELAARNHVHHPSFLPEQSELEVLGW